MGIEPTRATLRSQKNKGFPIAQTPKCEWRVNFGGTPGHVGIRRPTGASPDVPGDIAGRTVYRSIRRLSTTLRPSVFASQDP
jgi:hypothetical protein